MCYKRISSNIFYFLSKYLNPINIGVIVPIGILEIIFNGGVENQKKYSQWC